MLSKYLGMKTATLKTVQKRSKYTSSVFVALWMESPHPCGKFPDDSVLLSLVVVVHGGVSDPG